MCFRVGWRRRRCCGRLTGPHRLDRCVRHGRRSWLLGSGRSRRRRCGRRGHRFLRRGLWRSGLRRLRTFDDLGVTSWRLPQDKPINRCDRSERHDDDSGKQYCCRASPHWANRVAVLSRHAALDSGPRRSTARRWKRLVSVHRRKEWQREAENTEGTPRKQRAICLLSTFIRSWERRGRDRDEPVCSVLGGGIMKLWETNSVSCPQICQGPASQLSVAHDMSG